MARFVVMTTDKPFNLYLMKWELVFDWSVFLQLKAIISLVKTADKI